MEPPKSPAPDDEWVSIKVHAAFGGLRFLPWWWGTSSNSANPLLETGTSGIRYRALVLKEVGYPRIEMVDVRTAWRTVNLCFRFNDAIGTFRPTYATSKKLIGRCNS